MLNVNHSAPRHLRSYLVRTLMPHTLKGAEERCLYLLSPKQAGSKLWLFAILYHGILVTVGKGVATRDIGRAQGMARYGHKAQEIRGETLPVVKTPKAPKLSKDRLAAALAGEAA